MRRRPPRLVELSVEDAAELERLVRNGRTEQRIARRARILLAMNDPATVVQGLAERLGVARTTIWQVCRRYEAQGLAAVTDAPRAGRPRSISPPAAGPDRTTRML